MDNSVFESVEYNLDLICRVCMQESYNLRSIFDESVQTQPLNEIVMACAQIQVFIIYTLFHFSNSINKRINGFGLKWVSP